MHYITHYFLLPVKPTFAKRVILIECKLVIKIEIIITANLLQLFCNVC